MNGIMIQGTSSGSGKSFIVTGLCRLLTDIGLNVCPFKSQNMSNNSYTTHDGLEISTAQAVQAYSARLMPEAFMNPILLKPRHEQSSEVILNGKVYSPTTEGYREFSQTIGIDAVRKALRHIRGNFEAVIIEGAGSPAEINLNATEIVNMRIAREADVPVILVADVDRGGSLASVAGTLELLGHDRERVKGIIFNMFRGDMALFRDAVTWTENYTGVKVIGVVPFIKSVNIPDEDSLNLTEYHSDAPRGITIGILKFPNIANFSEFSPFAHESDVSTIYVDENIAVSKLHCFDAVILPDTNNITEAGKWLYSSGIGEFLRGFEGFIFGTGGGFGLLSDNVGGCFCFDGRKGENVPNDFRVSGTNFNRIFSNDNFRTMWLNSIRRSKNCGEHGITDTRTANDNSYNEIARILSQCLDIEYILRLICS